MPSDPATRRKFNPRSLVVTLTAHPPFGDERSINVGGLSAGCMVNAELGADESRSSFFVFSASAGLNCSATLCVSSALLHGYYAVAVRVARALIWSL